MQVILATPRGFCAGVARAIEILRTDVIRTLKLLGCGSVAALDGSYAGVPTEWTT